MVGTPISHPKMIIFSTGLLGKPTILGNPQMVMFKDFVRSFFFTLNIAWGNTKHPPIEDSVVNFDYPVHLFLVDVFLSETMDVPYFPST